MMERISVEVEFKQVNPELLALVMGEPTEPEFAIEVWTPIRRTWWQWLLRRPRQQRCTYIPRATVTKIEVE